MTQDGLGGMSAARPLADVGRGGHDQGRFADKKRRRHLSPAQLDQLQHLREARKKAVKGPGRCLPFDRAQTAPAGQAL